MQSLATGVKNTSRRPFDGTCELFATSTPSKIDNSRSGPRPPLDGVCCCFLRQRRKLLLPNRFNTCNASQTSHTFGTFAGGLFTLASQHAKPFVVECVVPVNLTFHSLRKLPKPLANTPDTSSWKAKLVAGGKPRGPTKNHDVPRQDAGITGLKIAERLCRRGCGLADGSRGDISGFRKASTPGCCKQSNHSAASEAQQAWERAAMRQSATKTGCT
mmetsp:Transcript_25254/g.50608  ORF Transcript_25254/g.50608 Transcript_25254/m.50608 type:complete len:216 (+) Transcript_25254:255-902(+)